MLRNPRPQSFRRIFAFAILVSALRVCAWSEDYKVLYNFKGNGSGVPSSGLTTDGANAYGTTYAGLPRDGGDVYELSPTTGYHLLYHFSDVNSGPADPQGTLALDSAGNLYGTTVFGGGLCSPGGSSCGLVYKLTPPVGGAGLWAEKVLYYFCSQANCSDGANPESGVILDSSGNLYGTTYNSANATGDFGNVFELSPNGFGGWTETILYTFCAQANCSDGSHPYGGLIFDTAGNLYGTTTSGGLGGGTVFELSPGAGGWTESTIYSFCSQPNCTDGEFPYAGVTFDLAGNLYGTTLQGGNNTGRGTVFELTPNVSGGAWTEKTLYSFSGPDGESPYAGVVLDPAGNVYGTTYHGGLNRSGCPSEGCGVVFRLTPTGSGPWTENMFRFPNEESGYNPMAPVIFVSGSVYGTTTFGGSQGNAGVAFKITP